METRSRTMADPFDPARAAAPTRTIPVDRILDLLCVTHAPERVLEYRRAMENGDRFPPIAVLPLAGRYVITDGHKRFAACRPLVAAGLCVEMWSFRRLAADLWRQLATQQRQAWSLLLRLPRDPAARRETKALLVQIATHWCRAARSLVALLRRDK